jgi:peptide/nickel transport system substrate-binding protein
MMRDERSRLVPALAERYEMLSPTVYVFHLKKGVRFHSGESFTARDVIHTYQSILDGEIISPYRESFSRIKEMTAINDHTVRIELKEVYAPFLTLTTMGIISHQAGLQGEEGSQQKLIGTGPYKLVRFVPETVVELAHNPDYFGMPPRLKNLRLQVIKDDNVRVLKLIKGDVDLVQNGVPALLLPKLVEKKGLKMIVGDGIVMTYMGFNLTDPVLQDRRVRQAIAYTLDRDQLIKHRFDGLAVKANSLMPPSNWAYAADLGQYNHDPKRAEELLAAAGLKPPAQGKPLVTFSQKTSVQKERVEIAKMISHQLGQVGIATNVQSYEWGTFYRDVKTGNFQLYTLSWVGITEPDFFYDVCHSSQFPPEGVNRDRYANPEVDKLVEHGRVTIDQDRRKEIYHQVQKILFRDLPFLPLWYEKNVVVYRPNLQGVTVRPDASYRTLVKVSKS